MIDNYIYTYIECYFDSHDSEVDFYLDQYQDAATLIDAIGYLNYHKSYTCIACGMREARTQIFQPYNGDRDDVLNIAIVFTDGKANVEQDQVEYEAAMLKSECG